VPKKSKWQDVDFSPADFRNRYNGLFMSKALPVIKKATYKSILAGDPAILSRAILKLQFPDDYYSLSALGLTWDFNQTIGLSKIAELLWFLFAPTNETIATHAVTKDVSKKVAQMELAQLAAGQLTGSFVHAWRIYDHSVQRKVLEAMRGVINETVTQTILEFPNNLKCQITRGKLYAIAKAEEEASRKLRMKIGQGGSATADYNVRWFPHNYARAYSMLITAQQRDENRRVSKRKSERQDWMAAIKKDFPELDEELIARLTGDPSDLKSQHSALLARKGGDSTPHQIALEQAARWCGQKPYLYKVRGLEKRLEQFSNFKQADMPARFFLFLKEWYEFGGVLTKERLKKALKVRSD